MDKNLIAKIISNQLSDETNLMVYYSTAYYSYYIGITLLWIAMLLTIYTGIDYLTKASPYLKGKDQRYDFAFSDLSSVRVALDQTLVSFDTSLTDVSEIAFFPPMTGG